MARGFRTSPGGSRVGWSSAWRSSNSRMWSQPATAKQIDALRANGNFDGNYYSKGRAGQAIGESARGAESSLTSRFQEAATASWHEPGAVIEVFIGVLSDPTSTVHTPPPRGHQGVVTTSIPHHHNVNQEDTTMSQLVPVTNNLASVVDLSANASATAAPFDFVEEMERAHLFAVASQVGVTEPRQVQALEKGWAKAKVTMATRFARAQNDLVAVLSDMPASTLASPEAAARELLWNACSAELEKTLMEMTKRAKGTTKPSHLLDLLLSEVDHRIEVAMIYAQGQVDVAKIQAVLPPVPTRGYEPCWGEVTGIKPYGAFITLPSGESGLLHVSELPSLNAGRRVDDATNVVNVGQHLRVRVIGKNDKSQLCFALVSEA